MYNFKEVPKVWYVKPSTENQAKILAKYFKDNNCGIEGFDYTENISAVLHLGLTKGFGFDKESIAEEIPFEIFETKILNNVEYLTEHLINFLIYLNDEKLINNHDFDYEKEVKKYVKIKIKNETTI